MNITKPTYEELEKKVFELEVQLTDRVKELECSDEFSKLVERTDNLHGILGQLVYILKGSWQFPDITEVHIINSGHTYKTEGFTETKWTMHSDIIVEGKATGKILISYLENRTNYPDPFLKEEYTLLHIVSERLGRVIERFRKGQRYFDLFESLLEGILKTDKNGIITKANPAAASICGYIDANDLIGKPMEVLYPNPEMRAEILREIKQEGGNVFNYEFQLKRKDDSVIPALCNTKMMVNEEGDFDGTLAAFTDISEKKKSEQKLIESEKELSYKNNVFNTLLDNLTQGVFMVEAPSGKPILINNAAREILERGIMPDTNKTNLQTIYKAYKESTGETYPPDEMPVIRAMYGEESYVDDMLIETDSGSRRNLEVYGNPVYNEKREVWASIATFADITDRKIIANKLRESEQRLRNISDNIPKGLIFQLIVQRNGKRRFTFLSKRVEEFHECTAEQVSAEPDLFLNRVLPEDIPEYQAKAKKAIREVSMFDHIVRIKRNSGEIRWHRLIAQPRQGNNGEVIADGIELDITSEKKQELLIEKYSKELEKLNADKDKFISILAHDLRGPLSALIGFSDYLSKNIREIGIDKAEEYFSKLHRTVHSTYKILEDILEWSFAKSEGRGYNPVDILLHSLCKDVIEISYNSAEAKDISLSCNIPLELIVHTDERLLKAVLRNLLSNAIKFTHQNGKVTVDATEAENAIVVLVEDTGVGMKEEALSKIFNIDSISSSKGTAGEQGTGLGLQICKEFVEKIGGEIWAESEAGKGSVFYFSIPKQMDTENTNKA